MASIRPGDVDRLLQSMIDRRMNEAIARVESESTDGEEDLRVAAESVDVTISYMFPKEAIGRAAEHFSGDRMLALTVIASALGTQQTTLEADRECEQCNSSDVVTILPYASRPVQVVCSDCGLIEVNAN